MAMAEAKMATALCLHLARACTCAHARPTHRTTRQVEFADDVTDSWLGEFDLCRKEADSDEAVCKDPAVVYAASAYFYAANSLGLVGWSEEKGVSTAQVVRCRHSTSRPC